MNRGQPQNFGRGFDATILQIRAGIELLEASYEHWRFWHQLFFVAKHWHLQQTFRKVLANIGAKGKEPATPSALYDWQASSAVEHKHLPVLEVLEASFSFSFSWTPPSLPYAVLVQTLLGSQSKAPIN